MPETKTQTLPPGPPPGYRYHTEIFLQEACFLHRFIRSRATSRIVERPERLRAVMVGVSAAIARLEEHVAPRGVFASDESETIVSSGASPGHSDAVSASGTEGLEAALGRMTLTQRQQQSAVRISPAVPVTIVHSQSFLDLLNNPAVKFVHGDVDGDTYLQNLIRWAQESEDKIVKGESEIPQGLSQGDLYLCPQSVNAIRGALGTVCEAVDRVMISPLEGGLQIGSNVRRGFVAVRPPGHHCGEDTPSGFCFVNNVAVAAAHAHLKHGVQRVVILDIDLHHGNGTQSIVWQINEETYRQVLENESGGGVKKTGPQIFYGSIHDILSYPCEDGKPELVQAASVSIHKAHGQYIENVHLEPYSSEENFWGLYKNKYSRLLQKAEEFLLDTGGPGEDVLFFISCGMDACEHEYESMSRHGRKVPVEFYFQFTRDACGLSEKYATGRIISVLEGGYNDRALISGSLAHLSAMVTAHNGPIDDKVNKDWWCVDNLAKLERATKQRKGPGGRKSLQNNEPAEAWLDRAVDILSVVDSGSATRPSAPRRSSAPSPSASSMTLRDRSKKGKDSSHPPSPPPLPPPPPPLRTETTKPREGTKQKPGKVSPSTSSESAVGSSEDGGQPVVSVKKLPRVILKLGPPE